MASITTRTTDTMGDNYINNRPVVCNLNSTFLKVGIVGVLTFTILPVANSARWEITPSVTLRQTYSDNINLDPSGQEESCFFTELDPGLSIRPRREGGRIQFNFNTRIQTPLTLGCDEASSSSFIQHQSNMLAEIIKESIFLEATSSISQQNSNSSGRTGTDSRSDTGNRTRVRTFSISPYWTPHIGGYADGEVRARYSTVTTSSDDSSDSSTHAENIHMQSGRRFTFLSWRLDFNNQEESRDSDGDSVRFRDYSAEVGYRLTREFDLFVRAGHFDNDFTSTTDSNRNGSFVTYGGGWTPSPKFSIRAGAGRNSFVTVNYNPSRRTSLQTTYSRNDVGTNTGDTWSLDLQHRTRRTVWSARYFEDTTTVQQILLQQQIFVLVDQFGNPIPNPVTDQPILIAIDIPTLSDDVLERKRGELSVSGRTAHSTVSLTLYNSKRKFQASGDEDDVFGWTTSWNWRFGKKTSSNLRFRWQKTDNNDDQGDDKFSEVAFRIDRNLSRYFTANFEYRFQQQDSDRSENEFKENRVSASVTYRF